MCKLSNLQLQKISSVTSDVLVKSGLQKQIGATALRTVQWDLKKDEWRQTASDARFLSAVHEKKLDTIGAPLLREKTGSVLKIGDVSFSKRIFDSSYSHTDTIITKITPNGFDEIIVTTVDELDAKKLMTLERIMPAAICAINSELKAIIFPTIKLADTVSRLHAQQTAQLLDMRERSICRKDGFNNTKKHLTFGDISLSRNELAVIQGTIFGLSDSRVECSRATASSIRSRMIKNLSAKSWPDCMRIFRDLGVIEYICNYTN